MRNKNDGLLLLGITGLVFVVIFGLVLRTRFKEDNPQVNAQILTTPVILPELPAEQSAQPQNDNNPEGGISELALSMNGITFTILEFTSYQQYLDIQVCFNLPDNGDWLVDKAHVLINAVSYPLQGTGLIELIRFPVDGQQQITKYEHGQRNTNYVSAAEAQPPRRCDHLLFEQPADTFTFARLEIERITAFPSEGGVCDPIYLNKLQRTLDLRQTGIIVDCFIQDGSSGLNVVSKPENMTAEEALAIVNSPEVILEVNGIRGPWAFDLVYGQ